MNVRTLNLRGTPLGNQSQAEVISIMQNIDSAITSVNLRDTSLGNKSATELIAILKALPPTVTTLNLDWNDLETKTVADLIAIFNELPANITSLSIRNIFVQKSAADVSAILQALPLTIISLDLGENSLGSRTADDLHTILNSVQPTVTSLYLDSNYLGEIDNGLLSRRVLNSLPATINTLSLASNWGGLYYRTGTELTEVISNLAPTITSLNLDYNGLWLDARVRENFPAMVLALQNSSIKHLTLRHNNIHQCDRDQIAAMLDLLSRCNITFDLSDFAGPPVKINELIKIIQNNLAIATASIVGYERLSEAITAVNELAFKQAKPVLTDELNLEPVSHLIQEKLTGKFDPLVFKQSASSSAASTSSQLDFSSSSSSTETSSSAAQNQNERSKWKMAFLNKIERDTTIAKNAKKQLTPDDPHKANNTNTPSTQKPK